MRRYKNFVAAITAGIMILSNAGFAVSADNAAALALADTDISEAAAASSATDEYVMQGKRKIAKIAANGNLEMIMQSSAHLNGSALNYLIHDYKSAKKQKTIRLPKGTFKTDRSLNIVGDLTILASGTTVYQTNPEKNIIYHEPTKTDRKSITNVKIKGGTWKIKDNTKQKRNTSTFRFNFASGITLDGCTVLTNHRSHAVELIACKNVKINNCKLIAKGKKIKTSLEEALQIDLSTKATAPTVAEFGSKFVKGQTCENIRVTNCVISGSRGICANKTDTEGEKYLGKYHRNITISGCKITGETSEAVALHNAVGVTVKNNTIVSKGSRVDTVYSIGLNIATFKKNGISAKYKNVITGNTVKGGRQGIFMAAYAGNKFGTTTVKNNKVYCKKGKKKAISVSDCKKLISKGNKTYKWS